MKIMLIHGQGRSPLAMAILGWRLRRHTVCYFGYRCRRETLTQIRVRFVEKLRQEMAGQPYLIVSHSLGGIITRLSLPYLPEMPPQHLIMLAPPNQPAKLAQTMERRFLYRWLTGDCGQNLASPQFYQSLPGPTIPTTIIAGTKDLNGKRTPFGSQPNDSVLTVSETRLDNQPEPLLIHATHTFIMNSPQVARIVLDIAERND